MTDPRAEERAIYDGTDYADLDLELADDVKVARGPAPLSTFALRLDGETIGQLRHLAATQGTRPTQLVRGWIEQRLHQELAPPPPMFKVNSEFQAIDVLRGIHDKPLLAHIQSGDVEEVVESVATALRKALTRIVERVDS